MSLALLKIVQLFPAFPQPKLSHHYPTYGLYFVPFGECRIAEYFLSCFLLLLDTDIVLPGTFNMRTWCEDQVEVHSLVQVERLLHLGKGNIYLLNALSVKFFTCIFLNLFVLLVSVPQVVSHSLTWWLHTDIENLP